MNTPNPLIPQGTLDRQSKGKSTVRIAIFTIISIHAVFFAGLLMQGCRPDAAAKTGMKTAEAATNSLPSIDGGYYPGTQEAAQSQPTNSPLATNLAPTAVSEAANLLPQAGASAPASEGKLYTVAKGDTLAKIAKSNRITVGAITKVNPSVDPGKLRPGQKIQIPAASGPATAGIGFKEPSTAGSESASSAGQVHVVKAGDTLTKIAKHHGTTVKAIRAANTLKTDLLVAGQKIKLPAAHLAHAAVDTSKKLSASATNPAHISPVASNSAGLSPR